MLHLGSSVDSSSFVLGNISKDPMSLLMTRTETFWTQIFDPSLRTKYDSERIPFWNGHTKDEVDNERLDYVLLLSIRRVIAHFGEETINWKWCVRNAWCILIEHYDESGGDIK